MTTEGLTEIVEYVENCARQARENVAEDLYNLTFGDPSKAAVYHEDIWEDEEL